MIPKATKLYEKMMSVWPERDDHFLAGLFEVYAKMESFNRSNGYELFINLYNKQYTGPYQRSLFNRIQPDNAALIIYCLYSIRLMLEHHKDQLVGQDLDALTLGIFEHQISMSDKYSNNLAVSMFNNLQNSVVFHKAYLTPLKGLVMEIAGEDAKYVYGHELLKIPSVKQAKIHAILISATTDDVDVEDCIVRYIIDHKAAFEADICEHVNSLNNHRSNFDALQ